MSWGWMIRPLTGPDTETLECVGRHVKHCCASSLQQTSFKTALTAGILVTDQTVVLRCSDNPLHETLFAAALHRGRNAQRLPVFGNGAAGDIDSVDLQFLNDHIV